MASDRHCDDENVSLLASYNLCSVWLAWEVTGNQGCHSYSARYSQAAKYAP